MSKEIHIQDLNDIFEEHLGQTFTTSKTDTAGCYMSRASGRHMSPKVICEMVKEILELAGVTLEGESRDEQAEEDAAEEAYMERLKKRHCL